MSNNKSNDPRDYDENGDLYTFEDVRNEEIHELQKKVEDLQIKSKKQSEKYDELCYEIDEINRKWAEDNERNGDILSEQQEQIIRLEEENERLEEEKQELKSEADRWEGEHSDLWYSVFGALDDGGYSATSTGQLISFIRDIIEENEKLKEENEKLGFMLDDERNQQFHKETHEAVYGK